MKGERPSSVQLTERFGRFSADLKGAPPMHKASVDASDQPYSMRHSMQLPQGESGIVQDTIIKKSGESSDGSESLTLESDCQETN